MGQSLHIGILSYNVLMWEELKVNAELLRISFQIRTSIVKEFFITSVVILISILFTFPR